MISFEFKDIYLCVILFLIIWFRVKISSSRILIPISQKHFSSKYNKI